MKSTFTKIRFPTYIFYTFTWLVTSDACRKMNRKRWQMLLPTNIFLMALIWDDVKLLFPLFTSKPRFNVKKNLTQKRGLVVKTNKKNDWIASVSMFVNQDRILCFLFTLPIKCSRKVNSFWNLRNRKHFPCFHTSYRNTSGSLGERKTWK